MLIQPTLMTGLGQIQFSGSAIIGVLSSPHFYSGYGYFDARKASAQIFIGDGVYINNNSTIICEETSIYIGDRTLIGMNCEIMDSDFHDLDPNHRLDGKPKTAPVHIGCNVFIGSGVKILKGVTIGDHSVIAAGSIVNADIPSHVIAGGIPAKIIRELKS